MNCALITGGSKGIGSAIAMQLSRDHGFHVLINHSSDTTAAAETRNKIHEEGGSAELLKFNVQDRLEVDKNIAAWQAGNPEKFISVLVNNAGITRDGLFMWMPENNWNDVIGTCLNGMFHVTQNVLRPMLHHKMGRIINMASLSGLKGVAGQTNYSAAKAGIIGATKALAQEVARMNITVNAVAPGFIKTDMTEGLNEAELKNMVPLKRFGTPEEVAHTVGFLATEGAAYITGEVISVNGGLYS